MNPTGLRFQAREIFLDILVFGLKQARSCFFAGGFFLLLFVSNYLPLGGLARYDFLFLSALALQIILVVVGQETSKELLVIFMFHLFGLGLELFKTQPWVGSWSYPEPGFFKLGGVPLYSGFMYAAVGSFIMASWRHLRLRFEPNPASWLGVLVCTLIYANFFLNHWIVDLRLGLLVLVIAIYGRTWVHFTPRSREYRMPLILGFFLIGFFIWLAENIATFFGAWQYPDQSERWDWVSFSKISSWGLLVILSFVIVSVWKSRAKE